MTGIRVAGSNWDAAMLQALADEPPDATAPHRHVLETVVAVIGDDVKAFLHSAGGPYLACWRGPTDPVAAMVSWLAAYYLQMHEVLRLGPAAIPGWAGLVRAAVEPGRDVRLVLTMQLGYPLLLPLLLEEATGRPVQPVVHDQNPPVLELYAKRLRGRALVLGSFGAADIRDCLDSGGILLANVDTSYPGTRHVREVPFLGHRLAMPTGLLALAVRRAAEVRAMALVGAADRLALLSGPALPGDTARAAQDFAAGFEHWVIARPEQWMAWASLERPC